MKVHRLFLASALLALAAGTLLGTRMGLGLAGIASMESWVEMLSAHAVLQVKGFVMLFTLGVALLVLPRFLKVELAIPQVAVASWLALVSGLLLELAQVAPGPRQGLEIFGVLAFMAVLKKTRGQVALAEADPKERSLNRLHAVFMATGVIWLLVGLLHPLAHHLLLWGFAALYVAGIGLRVHPQMLGLDPDLELLPYSVAMWNAGLALQAFGIEAGSLLTSFGVCVYLGALSPFRKPVRQPQAPAWLRAYLLTAYGWLVAAAIAAFFVGVDGPARHLMASGFLLTMMFGMALHLVPAFESRTLPVNPAWLLGLLTLGNLLRIGGQFELSQAYGREVFAAGAGLQTLAGLFFILIIAVTLGRAPQQVQAPSWLTGEV
ncbi:MAG: hypothetical protein AB7S38_19430 [Vulcanimicrobiota bacterium]